MVMNHLNLSKKSLVEHSTLNLRSIRPEGDEFFHADGRLKSKAVRYEEANSRFSQLCEGAINVISVLSITTFQIEEYSFRTPQIYLPILLVFTR